MTATPALPQKSGRHAPFYHFYGQLTKHISIRRRVVNMEFQQFRQIVNNSHSSTKTQIDWLTDWRRESGVASAFSPSLKTDFFALKTLNHKGKKNKYNRIMGEKRNSLKIEVQSFDIAIFEFGWGKMSRMIHIFKNWLFSVLTTPHVVYYCDW